MIISVSSGKAGFKDYLEHGQKKGREFHRDELDQRVSLAGDLAAWALACEDANAKGYRFDHFTLSFAEEYVSDELLQKAVAEFRDHIFAAWPEAERHRIPFYAEAHRPKVKTYVNAETGETVERKTHIHIGVGLHDLLTGKRIQLTGFLGQDASDNAQYLDAFQESFNARHGLASPKASPRIAPETAVDALARYTGQRPDELGTFNERKASLEVRIQKAVLDRGVTTWEGFRRVLAEFGNVSKVRAGRFNESYAIVPNGESRRIRLQGVFFQREFIERPTVGKLQVLTERARQAYVEQRAPLVDPAHLRSTLDEWHAVKAREIRFLHTGSSFYNEVYLAADAAGRARILDDLQRESERSTDGVPSPADDRQRQVATARGRLPKLQVRHMDGIQERSEMLLRRDGGLDVRAGAESAPTGHRLRQADGGGGGRGRARGPLTQPSRVVTQLREDLLQRYEVARADRKYTEIRRNLDCGQLLARLSHSHGLQADLYGVERVTDGSSRIRCGSRLLTPSDFLSQEMGLRWREAAPILREVYEQQLGKRVVRPRSRGDGVEARRLWREFQQSLPDQSAVAERHARFDVQTKEGRVALAAMLRRERAEALAGLRGQERQAALAAQRLRAVVARAEYSEGRRELRRMIRPPQGEAWRSFLQGRAQAGDAAALRALRRLDDTAREQGGLTISCADGIAAEELAKKRRALAMSEVLKTLQARVERNGDVTYTVVGGRAMLRDQGDRLQVLEPNSDEAILAALALAQDLFGPSLTLTGAPEFQRRVVALAAEHRVPVKFEDQGLEDLRQQLRATKSRSGGQTPRKVDASLNVTPDSAVSDRADTAVDGPSAEAPAAEPVTMTESAGERAVPDPVPSSGESRSALESALLGQGLEVREAVDQVLYVGSVLDVTPAGQLVQRVAPRAVIVHDLARLDGQYAVGQQVEIRYKGERGVDRLQVGAGRRDRGRSR